MTNRVGQAKTIAERRLSYKYRVLQRRVRPAVKRAFLKIAREMFLDQLSRGVSIKKKD
ncbi:MULTISPECIES: hypothetical protein [Thermoactinomyces]|uniref:Uncharacterized protein n=1 Tax=Thermoactinomyces daqus TaxID=1329516 RepID=A0A7W1XB44_9BACL|nr:MULTISPECIES: hypothetical protein [Thermoactinomyces]MBA4543308.1 hypothetical protein [Thermoactinomyces daqus]MBH8598449.1 hypothetical protein [Thermoactinomyces sp. CICC 10523]MBH8604706.1 hypothetical protein [Thermoactinomyces sp. CICC 10522]MBH8606833.1 hypothetical protein [Thermoactinomyces sp. CICC 10521]